MNRDEKIGCLAMVLAALDDVRDDPSTAVRYQIIAAEAVDRLDLRGSVTVIGYGRPAPRATASELGALDRLVGLALGVRYRPGDR